MDEELARAPRRCKAFCFYWTLSGENGDTVEGFIQAYHSVTPDVGAPDWESIDLGWEPPEEGEEDATQPGTFLGPRGSFDNPEFLAGVRAMIESGMAKSQMVQQRLQAGERFLYTVHGEGVAEHKGSARAPRRRSSARRPSGRS